MNQNGKLSWWLTLKNNSHQLKVLGLLRGSDKAIGCDLGAQPCPVSPGSLDNEVVEAKLGGLTLRWLPCLGSSEVILGGAHWSLSWGPDGVVLHPLGHAHMLISDYFLMQPRQVSTPAPAEDSC